MDCPCVCGHSFEEHGHDKLYPNSMACTECECIHYEAGDEPPPDGGIHFGSHRRPFIEAPCVVCGAPTVLACSDCAIDSGGTNSVHVCNKSACRDEHEKLHEDRHE